MSTGNLARSFALDDADDLAAVSEIVRAWEPLLDVVRPPTDALFYEPDGTSFAVALTSNMVARLGHSERRVGKGDLLVIPREFALDLGPDVDLLVIRDQGPPPDHFRERFLQVWGYQHFAAAPTSELAAGAYREIIPASEVRFRVLYAIVSVKPGEPHEFATSEALRLGVSLDGGCQVMDLGAEFAVPVRHGFFIPPGASCRVVGTGGTGVLTLHHRLAHEARRHDAASAGSGSLSPECSSESANRPQSG